MLARNQPVKVGDWQLRGEEVFDFLSRQVVEVPDLVGGQNFEMHRHIADPLLVFQLQPRREWHLLADLGDELLVYLGAPLEAVQGMLQFIHELVGFSPETGGIAGGFQIGYGADLISFCLIRHQSEIPPGTLLLGAFCFPFFVPILMRETAFHETGETISFDHGYQVEIEVSSVLGRCFAVQGEGSVEFDLLLHQIHDCLICPSSSRFALR